MTACQHFHKIDTLSYMHDYALLHSLTSGDSPKIWTNQNELLLKRLFMFGTIQQTCLGPVYRDR